MIVGDTTLTCVYVVKQKGLCFEIPLSGEFRASKLQQWNKFWEPDNSSWRSQDPWISGTILALEILGFVAPSSRGPQAYNVTLKFIECWRDLWKNFGLNDYVWCGGITLTPQVWNNWDAMTCWVGFQKIPEEKDTSADAKLYQRRKTTSLGPLSLCWTFTGRNFKTTYPNEQRPLHSSKCPLHCRGLYHPIN